MRWQVRCGVDSLRATEFTRLRQAAAAETQEHAAPGLLVRVASDQLPLFPDAEVGAEEGQARGSPAARLQEAPAGSQRAEAKPGTLHRSSKSCVIYADVEKHASA